MSPLNALMNHVSELSSSENCFTRNVSSRSAMLLGGIPLEILAAVQNVIILPFQPVGVVCKWSVKTLNLCCGSQFLSDVEEALPGIRQIVVTAYKVIAYTIGTIFTGVLGIISPMANFRLHYALGLVRDEKLEAERIQANEETAKEREMQEALMQAQIQAMLFAMRQKAVEQERLREEEAKKERENQKAISKLGKADNEKQTGLTVRFMQDTLAKEPIFPETEKKSSVSHLQVDQPTYEEKKESLPPIEEEREGKGLLRWLGETLFGTNEVSPPV